MTSYEIWMRDGFDTDPKENSPEKLQAAWLKEIAYQLAVFNEGSGNELRANKVCFASEPGGRLDSSARHRWQGPVDGGAKGHGEDYAPGLQYDYDMLRGEEKLVREERDKARRDRDVARTALETALRHQVKAEGELDAANQHVKILEGRVRLQRAGLAPILRSCAQTIMENRMTGPDAVGYILGYADSVERAESANGAEGVNKKEAPSG